MAYFLGRDVAIGLTTEQPHYALELSGGDLQIAGHADNAYDADKVFVARRKDIGSAAEDTDVTFVSNTKSKTVKFSAGNCIPLYPRSDTHLQILGSELNGSLSPINCAKNIAGPLIFFIHFLQNYLNMKLLGSH